MGTQTDSPNALIARYSTLARNLARPYCRHFPEWSAEFTGAALLALVEAAQRFNPNRGVGFPAYARRRINGALIDERAKILNWEQSCDYIDEFSSEPEADGGVDPAEFERAIAGLPAVLKPLLRLLFVQGLHLEDAAAELRVPDAIARRRLADAADRLGRPAPRQRFDRTA